MILFPIFLLSAIGRKSVFLMNWFHFQKKESSGAKNHPKYKSIYQLWLIGVCHWSVKQVFSK